MGKEGYTIYWHCRRCGSKNPENANTCSHCKADLMVYGELVSSEPKKEKQKNGGGRSTLIILLILVVLLGAAVTILLGRETVTDSKSTQIPVLQTTPVAAPTDPTLPADTQPVPTDPPATDPPATQPPATEPPPTQPPLEPNTMIAVIDGNEYQFDLVSARVKYDLEKKFNYLSIQYQARNPRGELLYDCYLAFDANLGCGTYDIMGDNYALDLGFTLTPANLNTAYHSTRSGTPVAVGSFTITERSEDWQTYSGYANASLDSKDSQDVIEFDVSYFNFTVLRLHMRQ